MTAVMPTTIPGYIAGTWDIDAAHSDVSFSVRHMMVSKVRGRFNGVSGHIVTGAIDFAAAHREAIDEQVAVNDAAADVARRLAEQRASLIAS